ncbi:hypothetical protein SAMN05421750_101218 [Agrobacterium pusense]|nr:hypothetical protein SAMN05421750_101218 [Agrobacterium pusense]
MATSFAPLKLGVDGDGFIDSHNDTDKAQLQRNVCMVKRNWIYVGLLVFVSVGLLIDAAIWPAGPPSSFTANDLVQMIGIITLFAWWQIEDAEKRGSRRSSAVKFATILLAPVGLAIYLYQTRRWTRATLGLIAFMGGLLLAGILTLLLSDWLIQQGFFPPSFLSRY